MNYYIECFKKYVCFSGRARRKEYWMFVLFNMVISFVLGFFDGVIGVESLFSGLYGLVVFLPGLAVSVRRLHDIGRSGWWLLIGLIPFVGAIVLFVFDCMDSQPETNQYGPNPKALFV